MRMSSSSICVCLLVLATLGICLGLDLPPLPPSPQGAVTAGTAVYTGNDPDVQTLIETLKRNGFTDDEEVKEALRILRPEKFATPIRGKREAETPTEQTESAKLENDDGERLQSAGDSSSPEEGDEPALPDTPQETTDSPTPKGKGLEKLEAKELHPLTDPTVRRQKRSWSSDGYRELSPVDKILNAQRIPFEPTL